MNRSKPEQLRDELIGEAVLNLLRNKEPVNTTALIRQLRRMQASELDAGQLVLLTRIIEELEAVMARNNRSVLRQDEDDIRLRNRKNGVSNTSKPIKSGKLH